MPSPQQKSAKKTPQKYLISRPNPISVILRMDFPWSRKRLSGVFKGKYKISIVTESVKIKKSRSSWKMFQVVFKFSKISSMISKTLSWYLSKPTVNRHLSKKMGKKPAQKKSVKYLEIYQRIFIVDYWLIFETCQLYIKARRINPVILVKLDKIHQTWFFSYKSMKSKKFPFLLFFTTFSIGSLYFVTH